LAYLGFFSLPKTIAFFVVWELFCLVSFIFLNLPKEKIKDSGVSHINNINELNKGNEIQKSEMKDSCKEDDNWIMERLQNEEHDLLSIENLFINQASASYVNNDLD
jgi:hypothetical protein